MNSLSFSIITITYNAEEYLEKTIDSIVNQTKFDAIEYIIIDGGSTDGTLEIIKKYESKISYWISESDNGIYDAMNKGLQQSSGYYVWFMNAGDMIFSLNTVEIVLGKISKDNFPDIIYGETEIINNNGDTLGMRRLKSPKKLSWKSFMWGMLVCHQSFIMKRDVAPQYNLEYKLSSDIDWCICCLKKSRNNFNTKMILSSFLEGGVSKKQHKIALQERYRIMNVHYGWITTFFVHFWFALRFLYSKISKR